MQSLLAIKYLGRRCGGLCAVEKLAVLYLDMPCKACDVDLIQQKS